MRSLILSSRRPGGSSRLMPSARLSHSVARLAGRCRLPGSHWGTSEWRNDAAKLTDRLPNKREEIGDRESRFLLRFAPSAPIREVHWRLTISVSSLLHCADFTVFPQFFAWGARRHRIILRPRSSYINHRIALSVPWSIKSVRCAISCAKYCWLPCFLRYWNSAVIIPSLTKSHLTTS